MPSRAPLLEGGLFIGLFLELGVVLMKARFVITHELRFCFQLSQLRAQLLLFVAFSRQLLPRFGLAIDEELGLRPGPSLELAQPQQIRATRAHQLETVALGFDSRHRRALVVATRALTLDQLGLRRFGTRDLGRKLLSSLLGPLVP